MAWAALLVLGLAGMGPAVAATTDPAPVDAVPGADEARRLADRLCAAHRADPRPDGALPDLRARIEQMQPRGDPKLLPLSCGVWWRVTDDAASSELQRTEWRATLGATLVWQGRSADGLPLLRQAYEAFAAAGPAHGSYAARLAGMLAFVHTQRNQQDDALAWSLRAIDAQSRATGETDPHLLIALRNNHGGLLSATRRFDEAERWLQALLDDCDHDRLPCRVNEAAATLNLLAVVARRQSNLPRATAWNDEMLRRLDPADPQLQMHRLLALKSRSTLLQAQGRFDEAAVALVQAVETGRTAERLGVPDLLDHRSTVYEDLASLALARGEPRQAVTHAQAGVDLVAASGQGNTPRLARPLRHLGQAQHAAGDLGAAVLSFRRALALFTGAETGDRETWIALRLAYATTALELGQQQEASQALAALDPAAAGAALRLSPQEQAQRLALQARVALWRQQPAEAGAAAQAALQALAQAGLPPQAPQLRLLQAQRCELLGQGCAELQPLQAQQPGSRPDATSAQAQAQAAAAATPVPELEAAVELALTQDQLRQGRPADAEGHSRRALSAAADSGQPGVQWQAQWRHAQVQRQLGRLPAAIFHGKLALQALQQQRRTLLPLGPLADAHYLVDKAAAYRDLADWLLQAGRVGEALQVLALLKQHEQDEYIERGPRGTDAVAEITPGLNSREAAWLQRWQGATEAGRADADLLAQLRSRQAAGRITPAEQATLQALSAQLQAAQPRRWQQVETVLAGIAQDSVAAASAPSSGSAPTGARASGNPLTALPRPPAGTASLVLLSTASGLQMLSIGPRAQLLQRLDGSAETLARDVAALRDHLARPEGRRAASMPALLAALPADARQRFIALARAVDSHARRQHAQRLLLWLDGPLRYLPLALLHDGHQHLAERYRLELAGRPGRDQAAADQALQRPAAGPHATRAARAAPPAPPAQVRAFGVTQALADLPALPAVAEELCAIVDGPVEGLSAQESAQCQPGLLRGSGWANARFTEATLAGGGSARDAAAGVLHIGTHFVLRPGRMEQSWLLLGDGARLTLARLRQLPLGEPGLVTLSACETGLGTDSTTGDGREVDGLVEVLQRQGTRQVLASLWRVDDQATARFMARFYRHWQRQGGDAGLALHAVQRDAARAGEPPRDWAAFVLSDAGWSGRAPR